MNSLMFITPYKYDGLWVFDDPSVGLVREPFVSGVDTMIDRLTADISEAESGFTLLFSPQAFPGYGAELDWQREEFGGNWYFSPEYQIEGWLCPALLKYFDSAPGKLFAKAEQRRS